MIQAEVMATPQALRLEPSRPYQALHVVCETKVMLIFTFHFHALEKEMATHSSVLA